MVAEEQANEGEEAPVGTTQIAEGEAESGGGAAEAGGTEQGGGEGQNPEKAEAAASGDAAQDAGEAPAGDVGAPTAERGGSDEAAAAGEGQGEVPTAVGGEVEGGVGGEGSGEAAEPEGGEPEAAAGGDEEQMAADGEEDGDVEGQSMIEPRLTADEIEGFDEDFMVAEEEEENEENEENEEEASQEKQGGGDTEEAPGQEPAAEEQQAGETAGAGEEADVGGAAEEEQGEADYEHALEQAEQLQARLKQESVELQRKVRQALDLRNKGRVQDHKDGSRISSGTTRYLAAMKQMAALKEQKDELEVHYSTVILDLRSQLEERVRRSEDINRAFKHFMVEVAKSAEHSKTGQPIPPRLLNDLLTQEAEKQEQEQRARLRYMQLRHKMNKLEQKLREKEQLAEGLHLIDFEQLKIENQSLNEKIEERNEELLKLRKKTTTTVQILTHIKEKLQFVQKENGILMQKLQSMETQMAGQRDELQRVKSTRDRLRARGKAIKENAVYITNSLLLDDIQVQKARREELMEQTAELQQRHQELLASVAATTARIQAVQEMEANGTGLSNQEPHAASLASR